MKKFLKVLGVLILAVVVLLLSAPWLFQDKIETIIKNKLNGSMNAQIDFAEVDLSLFSAFPDARLSINKLSIINKEPFLGDTLFYSNSIKLDLPVRDLFNDANDPIHVNELIVEQATANFKVNEAGDANWDIAKSTVEDVNQVADSTSTNEDFSFDLEHYEIINSKFLYEDVTTKNMLVLESLNHQGTGDFSLATSELDTDTDAIVTYSLGDVNYLSQNLIKLDAVIGLDLEKQKYSFKENKAFINDLELKLDGFVDLEPESTMVDLSFDTPSSDFKNFFALIPQTYRSNLDGITTTGDFKLQGSIIGPVDDVHIPLLDITATSNNASFKYADLAQKVTNISIDAAVKNTTGLVDDTFLKISDASFNIGKDRLHGDVLVSNLTRNMLIDLNVDGAIDLANLSEAFPMESVQDLKGKLVADIATSFDMASVEKERYENIKTKGTATLTDFTFDSEDLKNPIQIQQAAVDMNRNRVKLDDFKATTGNTDFQANGAIDNLIGFMFQDQDLKGAFKVTSNQFDTSDFMTDDVTGTSSNETSGSTATTEEAIKIPSFLDANLDFNANQVLYDGLTLKNVSGIAIVRDETLTLNNTKTDIFNGRIGLDGSVSTKNETPVFNMLLDMADLDIAQSFDGFEMFQKLVPIIQIFKGKLNTKLELNGDLNNDLTPNLNTIAGGAFAQLLTREIDTEKTPLISKLDNELSFINLKDLKLSDLATNLTFKDGAVQVAPFNFNIKDIEVVASGSHSLTNDMNYTLDLNVPAKYLGKEGASLLAKLEASEVENIKVPIPVNLLGTITQPKVDLQLDLAVKNLTNQIIEIQKQRIKDQGKETLNDAVDDLLQGNDPLNTIKDGIGGILGNKKPKDSTSTKTPVDSTLVKKPKDTTAVGQIKEKAEDKVKEAAGNILNGLFKKKKN